ncbi:MAG: inorganic pyrophosphatase [Candidatus Methanofastidiosa archaeon]|nr:inorganic pyrophosphatase [Candidatus Methanofastidiosa archaeon]
MNITGYLGQKVNVVIDRPLGSKHPKHGFIYKVNYGYVPNTKAPDGEEIDAYFLCVDKPIDKTSGICIAIIHRTDDEDDKLVVAPNSEDFSNEEIEKLVEFQEKWFKHIILRAKI